MRSGAAPAVCTGPAGRVSEVAARVGVSEPVIFQNFGSKAALYTAVLGRVASQVRTELRALAGQHSPAPDLLARVLSPHPSVQPQDAGTNRGALCAHAATLAADRRPGLHPGIARTHPRLTRDAGPGPAQGRTSARASSVTTTHHHGQDSPVTTALSGRQLPGMLCSCLPAGSAGLPRSNNAAAGDAHLVPGSVPDFSG